VTPGYAGGHKENPTYEEVASGTTGHAEVVQVTFDPKQITYREILEVFFGIHDPTSLNRQGADTGTQYRSAIFYKDAEQKRIRYGERLGKLRAQLAGVRPRTPAHEIVRADRERCA